MSAKLDVSWFDLKKYDVIAELDLNGWYTQLFARCYISNGISKGKIDDFILDRMNKLQKNPIFSYESTGDEIELGEIYFESLKSYPFNTYSVYSTPTSSIWEGQELFEVFKPPFDIDRECDTPYDFLLNCTGEAHVSVMLDATDERILSDFKHWLTEYRKATGYELHKKDFSDKDLAYWHESRLLPYIDLTLSAAIEGKKITQAKIASLIFKDHQDIDLIDKLRRTIKPKADWLLSYKTLGAIQVQLYFAKGKNKKLA